MLPKAQKKIGDETRHLKMSPRRKKERGSEVAVDGVDYRPSKLPGAGQRTLVEECGLLVKPRAPRPRRCESFDEPLLIASGGRLKVLEVLTMLGVSAPRFVG